MIPCPLLPATKLPLLPLAGFWFNDSASTTSGSIDSVFNLVLWISTAFFVLIVGLMIIFLLKYRARPGHREQPSPSHNDTLEIVWSVIPTLLVALIFFVSFLVFLDARTPPADTYDINVTAWKWNFEFEYPNGLQHQELHMPPGRPVRLIQSSRDVIHSLYIPAFRCKMDVVPGRYTYQWFQSDKPGTYDLFCAEYCGTGHSNMNSVVVVHESQADFDKWLEAAGTPPEDPVEWGQLLYAKKGCSQCHSLDGTARTGGGPSFQASYGQEIALADGSTVTVDENYIRESIRQPMAKVHAGYKPLMPVFPEVLLKDEEIDALIAFIKSFKE